MVWHNTNQSGDPNPFGERAETEAALSAWLADEVLIGYKPCGYTRQHQNALLAWTASPLNIADRERTPFSRLLEQFRADFAQNVVSRWAPPAANPDSRRRFRR